MAVWHEPEFVRDLNRLLKWAIRHGNRFPEPGSAYLVVHHAEEQTVVLHGEGLRLLRSLQRRVSGSSTAALGPSPKDAESLLMAACRAGVQRTPSEAVDSLVRELDKPVQDWVVVEPITLYIPTRRLVVGRCTLAMAIPQRLFRSGWRTLGAAQEFEGPVVFTTVRARDRAGALILAGEQFAESSAILDVVDRPKRGRPEIAMVRGQDGIQGFMFHRQGWILDERAVQPPGRLISPYRQAALAAARPEERRTDWQRRVIAAMRWFSLGVRSAWTAERLVCLMAALECLFVPHEKIKDKGRAIGRGVTKLFLRREMTPEEQRRWLRELYRSRNSAVHAGRGYEHDLEVDMLADLTHIAVRWATHHLDPAHRDPGRSCRTFAQAQRCRPVGT